MNNWNNTNFHVYLELIQIVNQIKRRERLKGMVYLSDEVFKYPCIVTEEQGGYLLAILKNNNQSKESYVETLVKEGHPLYDRVNGATAVLNIAGPLQSVEGVGESYQAGVYSIYLNQAEHDIIINGEPT